MRLFFFSSGFLFFAICMHTVFNSYFQILGLKINWLLLIMLVLAIRYSKILIPFLGIFAGLICDGLSHGIMGLYGTSFFIILLLVSQIKKVVYSNTFFSISITVAGMTILEGWLSLSILGFFETNIEISSIIITSILPLAIFQGLLTPLVLKIIIFGDNYILKDFV